LFAFPGGADALEGLSLRSRHSSPPSVIRR
jgi:hypothetical protein